MKKRPFFIKKEIVALAFPLLSDKLLVLKKIIKRQQIAYDHPDI